MLRIIMGFFGIFFLGIVFMGWKAEKEGEAFDAKPLLSEYGFFKGKLSSLDPAAGVVPYELNVPLFSDYALKSRFVKLPEGGKAVFSPDKVFEFPVGTVLIKNFYYHKDDRKPAKGKLILETRLLIHTPEGWSAFPYIWNEEQTDATLEIAGGSRLISWINATGKKTEFDYFIPNVNQCKGCHSYNKGLASIESNLIREGDKMVLSGEIKPIGPSARQLNRILGNKENQLQHWEKHGMLTGLPPLELVEKFPEWGDGAVGAALVAALLPGAAGAAGAATRAAPTMARAYLDINCGHCHNPNGPANTSGMFLHFHETDPAKLGVNKSPISAGRGSGDRLYSIVPGKPDESILLFRMESTDPGIQMPELGRHLLDEEGIQLIREWIEVMSDE